MGPLLNKSLAHAVAHFAVLIVGSILIIVAVSFYLNRDIEEREQPAAALEAVPN